MGETKIDLPIRKLTVITRFSELCYTTDKSKMDKTTYVDAIIQDSDALQNGRYVFHLYKMEGDEMRGWKTFIDIPVHIEYEYKKK